MFRYCENVAKLHNIPIATSRSRRPPKKFDDVIVLETTGIRDESDNYKINLYHPVLDSELKRRFSDKNKNIMRALRACCPTSHNFFNTSHLQPLIITYGLDGEALSSETQVAKWTLVGNDLEDIELTPLKLAFPNLVKLLHIAMTICVSTATSLWQLTTAICTNRDSLLKWRL